MEEINDCDDTNNNINSNDNHIVVSDGNIDSVTAINENMNRGLLSSSENESKEQYYNLIGSNNDGFNSSDDDDDYNHDNDNEDSLTDHEPIDDDEFGEFGEYVQLNDVNEDIVEVFADNAISSLTNDYLRTIHQGNSNNNNTTNINNTIIEEEIPTIDDETYDRNENVITETKKVFPPSIPPLNAEKIDTIKIAMSKLKLTPRAGAESICQKILKSNLRIGDEKTI